MHQEAYNGKNQERWTLAKLKRGVERKPVAVDVKRTLAALYRTVASASASLAKAAWGLPAASKVRASSVSDWAESSSSLGK